MSEDMDCAACGMLVEPANAFHPWLYCELFKRGITNPAAFLDGQHFIPDPDRWGEDAPRRQAQVGHVRAARTVQRRRVLRSEVTA